ncbi:MAG: methyl-accepting chemotaxis protein [Candidatus Aquilonibacter sp.]
MRVSGVAELAVGDALADWLDRLVRERDFGLPLTLPEGLEEAGPVAGACLRLVYAFRSDLQRYDTIIASAGESIKRNREQIKQALADTKDYTSSIRHALSTLEEARAASGQVASQTDALEREALVVREASAGAVVEVSGGGIDELLESIISVKTAGAALTETSGGLAVFVDGIARISRRAALLSRSALIEAAHLGSEGQGFGIVATEVRTLAESTKASVRDVNTIAGRLAASTRQVVAATAQALAAAQKLGGDTASISEGVKRIDALVPAFAEPVDAIGAIANEQEAALPALVLNFEQIADLAEATVRAAEDASAIDLDSMFASVQSLLGSYRTGRFHAPALGTRDDGSTLAQAIDRVAEGDTGALADVQCEPGQERVVEAVERFVSTLIALERETLASITRIAVAVGRNSFAWKTIAANLARLKQLLNASRLALGESRDAASSLSAASQAIQRVASDLRSTAELPSSALASSVVSLGRVRDNVNHVHEFVTEMSSSLERVGAILSLVDEISSETNLLALNASIEAAHAGNAGLGFSVIAGEIRKLADHTHVATNEVGGVIETISRAGEGMRVGMLASAERTEEVEGRARQVESVVDRLLTTIASTVDRTQDLAALANQHMTEFDGLLRELDTTAAAIDVSTAAATDSRRLELANIGRGAHEFAAQRRLGTVAERIRELGMTLAGEMDAVFDAAIDSGAVTFTDCTDTDYVPITGARIADLSRLFNVSKVPASGFDPPKFATRYDRAVEAGINAIIDRWVPVNSSIKAMFAVDLNGYCFGHYKECRHDWTGDYLTDLNNNRIKRFFEDALSLRCSRVGLGAGADNRPPRTPYAEFQRDGCVLTRGGNQRPWAIYTYARDTGIVYNDLSLALFATDRRVGTIRIIYDADVV